MTAIAPPGRASADLAAAVFALAGIRRGHVVLDLTPSAGLGATAAAAAGDHGLVIAHQEPGSPLPLGAGCAVADLTTVLANAPTGGARVARLLVTAPEVDARSVEQHLRDASASLAPGARVAVACRPSHGDIGDGLPAVLGRCGLRVVHAERLTLPEGDVTVAVGVPVDAHDG